MGRPRDLDAKDRILRSTANLVTTPGADASINAIVAQAGVGKATVYRWWDSRTAVVLDALRYQSDVLPLEKVATDDPLADLHVMLLQVAKLLLPPTGHLVRDLTAAMLQGESDAFEIRTLLIEEPVALLTNAVLRVVQDGQAREQQETEQTVHALLGALWVPVLSASPPTVDPETMVAQILATVLPTPG